MDADRAQNFQKLDFDELEAAASYGSDRVASPLADQGPSQVLVDGEWVNPREIEPAEGFVSGFTEDGVLRFKEYDGFLYNIDNTPYLDDEGRILSYWDIDAQDYGGSTYLQIESVTDPAELQIPDYLQTRIESVADPTPDPLESVAQTSQILEGSGASEDIVATQSQLSDIQQTVDAETLESGARTLQESGEQSAAESGARTLQEGGEQSAAESNQPQRAGREPFKKAANNKRQRAATLKKALRPHIDRQYMKPILKPVSQPLPRPAKPAPLPPKQESSIRRTENFVN